MACQATQKKCMQSHCQGMSGLSLMAPHSWTGATYFCQIKLSSLPRKWGWNTRERIPQLPSSAVQGDTLEILSLDSLRENQGIGSALVDLAVQEARDQKCRRVVLITTNDNIRALRFYQRRGFDMSNFYRNAMDLARKLKPGIPAVGENQIPLRHEIEFEMLL